MFSTRSVQLAAVVVLLACLNPVVAQVAPKAQAIEFWNDSMPSSGLKPKHQAWQDILNTYLVSNHPSGVNMFDYQGVIEADEQRLANYLSYLQQLDPRQLTRTRQTAYWLNLYNATLVALIVTNGSGKSIRGLNRSDFWALTRFNIAGQKLSFNDIEHGILRPIFSDVRIHFALFRGAVGSANLAARPYSGDTLEQDLDAAARAFITHPRAVSFDKNELRISRIFKWRETDFGKSRQDIKAYIKRYLDTDSASKVDQAGRIRYQFDWSLNSSS